VGGKGKGGLLARKKKKGNGKREFLTDKKDLRTGSGKLLGRKLWGGGKQGGKGVKQEGKEERKGMGGRGMFRLRVITKSQRQNTGWVRCEWENSLAIHFPRYQCD